MPFFIILAKVSGVAGAFHNLIPPTLYKVCVATTSNVLTFVFPNCFQVVSFKHATIILVILVIPQCIFN